MSSNTAGFAEVYDVLNLYITPEKFFIQPLQDDKTLLVIDRANGEAAISSNNDQIPATASRREIYGILGRIRLIAGYYLIVVTKRKRIGQISSNDIWQLNQVEMIPYSRTSLHMSHEQMNADRKYLAMIQSIFDTPYFYFSYSYDLTHTMQRLHDTSPNFLSISMWARADKRFVWNNNLLEEFCCYKSFHKFALPLIHGFVSINPHTFTFDGEEKTFMWILVARRSCQRAGTRLFKRGIDSIGQVANFVETEQIVEYNGARSSFVQIRGSIPCYWQQLPDLRLRPLPEVIASENHVEACSKHFEDLNILYNHVVAVNLINHTGSEGKLAEKFEALVNEINNKKVRYEGYDFHNETKNMQYHKLQTLIDRLSDEQDKFGFLLYSNGKVISSQGGIFRTNCIDCLDRTNVVQSIIAWRSVQTVLEKIGLIPEGQSISSTDDFYQLFQNVWADHADVISVQYSGTGALKTDYTRTGKRTFKGMLNDVGNSLTRYYKNNLRDGLRQDAIDLVQGNYMVQPGECRTQPCPLDKAPSLRYTIFTVIFLVAIAMFFGNAIFSTDYNTSTMLSLFFWGIMIIATFATIMYYGTEFVDEPKLVPIKRKNNAT